jgi:hypothetical protein
MIWIFSGSVKQGNLGTSLKIGDYFPSFESLKIDSNNVTMNKTSGNNIAATNSKVSLKRYGFSLRARSRKLFSYKREIPVSFSLRRS